MNINFITADWPAPECIVAGTTCKQGGYSTGAYAGFNLATHVGDALDAVNRNRKLLASELNLPALPHWLNQVHGSKIVDITASDISALNHECADAVISFKRNKVCVILTADCLPLLITDTSGSCVAAIHAGWRGLRDGIIERTILKLKKPPRELLVWIGPAISNDAFEVDTSVRDEFIKIDKASENAYTYTRPGHWKMDLVLLAKQRLIYSGINNSAIYGGKHCSYLENKLFYSYRRNKTTGRMASLIYIRNI